MFKKLIKFKFNVDDPVYVLVLLGAEWVIKNTIIRQVATISEDGKKFYNVYKDAEGVKVFEEDTFEKKTDATAEMAKRNLELAVKF